jgi:hypothetical protein
MSDWLKKVKALGPHLQYPEVGLEKRDAGTISNMTL